MPTFFPKISEMMKRFLALVYFVGLVGSLPLYGSIAASDPSGQGTQGFFGNMALRFTVNSTMDLTQHPRGWASTCSRRLAQWSCPPVTTRSWPRDLAYPTRTATWEPAPPSRPLAAGAARTKANAGFRCDLVTQRPAGVYLKHFSKVAIIYLAIVT